MEPIRVSLSAKFSRQYEMRTIARWLTELGYVVTSTWLHVEEDDDLGSERTPAMAEIDIRDVAVSDVLVAFAERPGTPGADRGGRHCELGAALALGKAVVLVGSPENIFHRHPLVTRVDNVREMAAALKAFAHAREEEARRVANLDAAMAAEYAAQPAPGRG